MNAARWSVVASVAIAPTGWLCWAWSTRDGNDALAWLGGLLYWLMPCCCVFAAVCALPLLRRGASGMSASARAQWPGLLLAVAATAVVFGVVAPEMRVQFDETCLVGTSQNMHAQRLAVMTTGAIPFDGAPFPLQSMVDKRPTLFSFLVSVVHELRGYRVENAFVVNAALLALGLFVVSVAARARLGLFGGLAAPLLLLAVPLTTVVATSAGFELLAAVLLALTVSQALSFVDEPDELRLLLLVGVGVLFAHARYESLPALAVLFALSWWMVRGRFRPGARSWLALAAAVPLVTPLGFLLQHARDPNFTPEAGGRALLSLGNFAEHVGPWLRAWFWPSAQNALPGVVAIVGAGAFSWRVVRGRAGRVDVLVFAPVLALTGLMLLWFYGDVREPTALRLFLPAAWATALLPLALLGRSANGRGGRVVAGVLLSAAALLAARGVWSVGTRTSFPELRIATLTRELDRLVARLPGDRGTTLWVGAPAQHLVVKGRAAVSARTFEQLGQRLDQLRAQGDLAEVYLLETPLDAAMAPALGSVRELLRRTPSRVVERVGGAMPITVHRLTR